MNVRIALAFAVTLCAAVAPVAAQQGPAPAHQAAISAARQASPGATLLGPRLPPQFQHFEPQLARIDESGNASSAAAAAGGQHTIVVSTLVLVLAAIIVVLLVVR